MQIEFEPFTLHKRHVLTISRGSSSQNTNVWVRVEAEGIEGWGEACPFAVDRQEQGLDSLLAALSVCQSLLSDYTPWQRQRIEQMLGEQQIPSAVRAALDMALYDWLGKRTATPLWQLWGFDIHRIPVTTVTIGISEPEVAQQRALAWMEQIPGLQAFKVKLGSSVGIEADQNMLIAIQEVIPIGSLLTVDANGGWMVEDALSMCQWLAGQGVAYVEQPLEKGKEAGLITLWHQSPLPIFVDESCWESLDIPPLKDRIHGINIKLMKSGGLTEALRMIHTARAEGLQVMMGCYGNSALANTAAAHLTPLLDYVDLDSHLNVVDDPFTGATLEQGCLIPSTEPGLGVRRVDPA
ncbi:MAG: dipeptide epimerase [Cyanobacteriota bacterium]|nr:dipeptide epimerase [Cyanobacteriota bacterium]